MRKKICLFLLTVCFLSSCSAYVDSKREAGRVYPLGQSSVQRPALCYNPVFGDSQQRQQLADETCSPKKAVLTETQYFNCTFFYPNTAFYKCE